MKFIKQFASLAAFNGFTLDSTNTPNVSLIQENYGIQYTEYIQPIHDYSQDYFTIEALDNISELILFYGNGSLYDAELKDYTEKPLGTAYYSLDNGNTWSEMENTVSLSAGDKIMFKGVPIQTRGSGMQSIFINGDTHNSQYIVDGRFNVSGNIMSLIYGDNFIGQTSFPAAFELGSEFSYLFLNQTNLINANNLILPATVLHDSSYSNMFEGCTSLISVPSLPGLSLEYQCYGAMFKGCTSLTTAPELPATTLCMCCYYGMFENCTSLITAPELPATTLAEHCYQYMFIGCTSLNYIKCLATDINAVDCLKEWVGGVASSGTFVKDSSMSSWDTGENGIPEGWTVQDA